MHCHSTTRVQDASPYRPPKSTLGLDASRGISRSGSRVTFIDKYFIRGESRLRLSYSTAYIKSCLRGVLELVHRLLV